MPMELMDCVSDPFGAISWNADTLNIIICTHNHSSTASLSYLPPFSQI